MGRFQHITWRLAFSLLLLAGGMVASALQTGNVALASSQRANTTLHPLITGNWYGAASTSWMVEATINIWPQKVSNACGVDTAIGMINYDALNTGVSMPEPASSNPEASIISDNVKYPTVSSETISQWGHGNYNSTGGYTNISNDFGTDPRSVAYMAWWYSISNRYFHNYIYRWQFAYGSDPGMSIDQIDATTLMARGVEQWSEPEVVFINGGEHAVLVTGVYSGSNPATNFPAEIGWISIRDPEGTPSYTANTDSSHYTVTYTQWTSGYQTPSFGYYSLWSPYYGNPSDPDVTANAYPTTQPDPYVTPPGSHWWNGFVWAQRDNNTGSTGTGTLGQWDPDWSFNAYTGNYMTSR